MEAALRLVDERGFSSLSLREVAREAGIVPTGFYRHFQDLDELGFALVDESFRSLRQMLRGAREGTADAAGIIRGSVAVLVLAIYEHRLHFRFIARERSGGVPALRRAIRSEIRLFSSELATDLSRFPNLGDWSSEDLQMIAGLMVNTMVATAEALLDAGPEDPVAEAEVVRVAEKQLRLIALGLPQWRSGEQGSTGTRPANTPTAPRRQTPAHPSEPGPTPRSRRSR